MAITRGYATLAQLRSEIGNYESSDTADDSKLELAVEAASRQIDAYCGQRFWQDDSVAIREFYADSKRCCYVDTDKAAGISTTTGLIVKIDDDGDGTFETTLTIATDFILLPRNAEDEDTPDRPYTEVWLADNYYFPLLSNGRPGVQVTAKFGWAAVPDDVEKACLIQAEMLFKVKDAPFGVASFGMEGNALRVRSKLHPLAEGLLADYRKPAVG